MNNKKNIFCEKLSFYRKNLSLTQSQLASSINKDLGIKSDEPGAVTQTYINKIEKGGVIVDYRITNNLLKRLFFLDTNKMNSAIELAQYIYDTIDVDKVDIEELFSFSKTRDLLNYIYKISCRDLSTIELANIKSRLQIIEKYMDDFPSTIYVDRNLNENSIEYEINSSALIVLYIVFFYITKIDFKDELLNEIAEEFRENEKNILSDSSFCDFFYNCTGVRISIDMPKTVKSKLIKSFLKKNEFIFKLQHYFQEWYAYCLGTVDLMYVMKDKYLGNEGLLYNIVDIGCELKKRDYVDDFNPVMCLMNQSDNIYLYINNPLKFLCPIYDFYLKKEDMLIFNTDFIVVEKYYNEIMNFLNSSNPESILNLGTLKSRVELLYKKMDRYFHKIEDMATISTMEWQDIIELQKSFLAIWKIVRNICLYNREECNKYKL